MTTMGLNYRLANVRYSSHCLTTVPVHLVTQLFKNSTQNSFSTYLIFRRYRFQYFGALVSTLGPRSKICSDHTNPDFRYRIRIIILRLNFLKSFLSNFLRGLTMYFPENDFAKVHFQLLPNFAQ